VIRGLLKGTAIVACAVSVLLATAIGGCCETLFYDSFEPPTNQGLWTLGPAGWSGAQGHDTLTNQNNHIRTPGVNGARSQANYRSTWNSQHALGASYGSNVYLKCWIFEDDDIPWPYPLLPGHTDEEWPDGYITLLNSAWLADPGAAGADAFSIGVMGEIGRVNGRFRAFFDDCSIYTTADDYVPLDGNGAPLVPRRQGWRKYTILVNGFTGNPGDVQFLIDDKVVYDGLRKEGAAFDTIVLGAKWWTYETYYYDQVEFGTIETAVPCITISEAKALPDETWVSLQSKVVAGCFSYSDLPPTPPAYDRPSPGYLAIEEDDRSSALWVSSSYQASVSSESNLAERVSVRGIMRTNEAGMRYLDAIEITRASDPESQPRVLGTTLRNLGSSLLDGRLVKVWGKVVNAPGYDPPTVMGQERPGDWRRYFMIDDGSPGGPVKCYYANIVVAKPGIVPSPAVANGNYVSVVGVAGREVLKPGVTGPEKSVWIRGAGDLKVLAAP
jgi:hypothetical protein